MSFIIYSCPAKLNVCENPSPNDRLLKSTFIWLPKSPPVIPKAALIIIDVPSNPNIVTIFLASADKLIEFDIVALIKETPNILLKEWVGVPIKKEVLVETGFHFFKIDWLPEKEKECLLTTVDHYIKSAKIRVI